MVILSNEHLPRCMVVGEGRRKNQRSVVDTKVRGSSSTHSAGNGVISWV